MSEGCPIDVKFFAPPEDLAPCFTSFYRLDVDLPPGESLEDWLQPEWANLRFFTDTPPDSDNRSGASVSGARFQATGPSDGPTHFRLYRTRMWGIGLLPLGWARFVGCPANDHINALVDGEHSETFASFAPLCDALCTHDAPVKNQIAAIADFFRNLAEPPRDQARILAIHAALVDPQLIEVTHFARDCGLSKRTLERVCARHFGFSPRLLLRRQRLMRSLAAFMLAAGSSWSESIDGHYTDQPHFVHEFQAFMGMNPSEYAALPHPVLAPFMAERAKVWGSPVQTLHIPR